MAVRPISLLAVDPEERLVAVRPISLALSCALMHLAADPEERLVAVRPISLALSCALMHLAADPEERLAAVRPISLALSCCLVKSHQPLLYGTVLCSKFCLHENI